MSIILYYSLVFKELVSRKFICKTFDLHCVSHNVYCPFECYPKIFTSICQYLTFCSAESGIFLAWPAGRQDWTWLNADQTKTRKPVGPKADKNIIDSISLKPAIAAVMWVQNLFSSRQGSSLKTFITFCCFSSGCVFSPVFPRSLHSPNACGSIESKLTVFVQL